MSASASPPSFPPSQRCFLDGLSLCFAKLDLADFLSAVVVCKHWRAASLHVPSIGFELKNVARKSQTEHRTESRWTPSGRLLNLVASPYRIHISSLQESHEHVWNLADLCLLHQLSHVTHIVALTINLAHFSKREAFDDFAFPAMLQSADLCFIFPDSPPGQDPDDDRPDANLIVLPGLIGCPALTNLRLTALPSHNSALSCHLDLSPLAELRQLRSLFLSRHFRPQEMQPLKQLESLERLEVCGDPRWILALCEGPHSLQRLTALDMAELNLASEHMQALRSLPALTVLEPTRLSLPAMALLPHFPQLLQLSISPKIVWSEPLSLAMHEARIEVTEVFFILRGSFLLPFLTCRDVHTFALDRFSLSEADAEELWSLLPSITSLVLSCCDLPSLQSLIKLPKLRSFEFDSLPSRPCDVKSEHLLACKALKSARLYSLGRELAASLYPVCSLSATPYGGPVVVFHRAD